MALSVGVLIPAWNEAQRVGATVAAAKSIPGVDEVLVVDDGSTDGTAVIAQEAGAIVHVLSQNSGKGNALRAGIKQCRCDILLLLDADLEASAAQAHTLLAPLLTDQADMAIARFTRGRPAGFGLVRGLATWGIRHLVGMVAESPLSGQRAVRKTLFDKVALEDGWGIEVALTIDAIRNGFRVVEIPVTMRHRETRRNLRGFLHRGRQFTGVLHALLTRCLGREKKSS